MADTAVLRARFAAFARMADGRLPLYHRLTEAASADDAVAARLLLARPDQRQPVLLLASVHDAVLAGEADELRGWYPSAVAEARPVGRGADDPWPLFREVALAHDGVERRLRTRATQTNEVGRCAPLLLALDHVARTAPGAPPSGRRPLGLVEVGASAGLNLRLDRYGYRFLPAGPHGDDQVATVGEEAPLVLECRWRGDRPPPVPADVPHLASRIGVDLEPVDLHARADARWLVACQWPEQEERVHRMRSAIALAHGDLPEVVAGDLVTEVAHLVRAVPLHALPVVVATWVLSYLSADRRAAFLDELLALGRERDLALVFAEQPDQVSGLPVPPRPDGVVDQRPTALVHVAIGPDGMAAERLADQHPHGTWVEWLAP